MFMHINRFALSIVTALVATSCSSSTRSSREPAPDEPVLRVMTYNVNFGLAGDPTTLAAIADTDADVVVLQETTPEWEAAIRGGLAERFPHMAFHHSRGAGGLAILSRFDFDRGELIEAPSDWFPAWRTTINGPLGPVQLLAVHLRPPVSDSGSVVSGYFTTQPVREAEIEAYLQRLDPELPTIIAGDFNERNGRAMQHLREQGFASTLPQFHGSQHTWRWNTSLGEVTSQLDHVMVDERLVALDARVLNAGRSDHLPVYVALTRAE